MDMNVPCIRRVSFHRTKTARLNPIKIKFTPYGIPYVEEFGNVSIAAATRPPTRRCPTCGKDPHPNEARDDADEKGKQRGLYIQFSPRRSRSSSPPPKISEGRLARLRQAIADAVTAAGMSSPPPSTEEKNDPMATATAGHDAARTRPIPARRGSSASASSTASKASSTSLFRGTYGQVMQALQAAGLTTTPCTGSGFEDATRLGALFVVKTSENGAVQFDKLTLWG